MQYFPPDTHLYPLGQQCILSEQHTAFGRGQHLYPIVVLQHVSLPEQKDSPSGQTLLSFA